MRLSRLRLRLAGVFALTLAVALALVAAASLGWLLWDSTIRFDRRVERMAASIEEAIARESAETPDSSLSFALAEVRRDWVWSGDQWIVMDSAGALLEALAPPDRTRRVLQALRESPGPTAAVRFVSELNDDDLRGAVRLVARHREIPPYTILAFASTEGIESDTKRLAAALAIAVPLIVLLSVFGGYGLARRALQPVRDLGAVLERIEPSDLSARVPVSSNPDEVDQVAAQFNSLLERLQEAQASNRRFVREAAHQVRTPLTLVRGEADLALAAEEPSADTMHSSLTRIRRASEQMQRRVDELMLLAEAEAGARIERRELVDVSSLLLEAVDMFRSRAAQLGHTLRIDRVDDLAINGNGELLREAMLELLENACRHSPTRSTVSASLVREEEMVRLTIDSESASQNEPITRAGGGVGHRIVRWIVEQHGGTFMSATDATLAGDSVYRAVLRFPLTESVT